MNISKFSIEFEKQSKNILEKYFEKHGCRERGKALVMYAEIMLLARQIFRKQHEEILKKLPKEKKKSAITRCCNRKARNTCFGFQCPKCLTVPAIIKT